MVLKNPYIESHTLEKKKKKKKKKKKNPFIEPLKLYEFYLYENLIGIKTIILKKFANFLLMI
jgi:hypothetical protein